MNSQFIERLINRTLSKESIVSIKPAITLDIVHEVFHLPEQQFMPFPLTSSTQSDLPPLSHLKSTPPQKEYAPQMPKPKALVSSTSKVIEATVPRDITRKETNVIGEVSKPKQMPELKDLAPSSSEASNAPVVRYGVSMKTDEYAHDTRALGIKREEPRGPTQFSKEKSTEIPTIEKKEEGAVKIEHGMVHAAPREPIEGPARKDETPFSPEDLHKPQLEVVIPAKPVKQAQTRSPVVWPKTYRSIPAREIIERSQVYSEPTVTIHIGRIEVRAIMPPKPFTKARIPVLSLKDYLKQRSEGSL